MKWSTLIWGVLIGVIILTGSKTDAMCQVDIRVPEVETEPDTTILIPVLVSDVTGYGIISYQFHVRFDSLVIRATDAKVENTISQPWGSVSVNLNTQGDIIIGAFGIEDLAGADTLLLLEFSVTGEVGDSTVVELDEVIFNNNNPTANIENGRLRIMLPSRIEFSSPAHLPEKIKLMHNYPEPFRDATRIQCYIDKPGRIEITIYNMLGQVVQIFNKDAISVGLHSFEWNAWQHSGEKLVAGAYFCVARLNNEIVGMERIIFID